MDDQPDITKAITLTEPEGKNTSWFLKGYWVRFVIECLQSWLNTEYIIKQTDGTNVLPPVYATVTTTKSGRTVVFEPLSSSGGGSATGATVGGPGPPTQTTLSAAGMPSSFVSGVTPTLYADETNDGLYFCSKAGTAATSQWTQIQGGSGSVSAFTVVSDGGTTILCAGGVSVNKPPLLTTAMSSRTIRGVSYNYGYAPTYISGSSGPVLYYTRSVSQGGSFIENDLVMPDYVPGDIIIASQVNGAWQDLNVDGRAWTMI